jgi:hypothetical protein
MNFFAISQKDKAAQLRKCGRFGRIALFIRLGGQFRRPEPDAWFYDEHEWHAHLNGLTGYGLTCTAAVLDWIEKTPPHRDLKRNA